MIGIVSRMVAAAIKDGHDDLAELVSGDFPELVWYGVMSDIEVPIEILRRYYRQVPMPHSMISFGVSNYSFPPPIRSSVEFRTYNTNIANVRRVRNEASRI